MKRDIEQFKEAVQQSTSIRQTLIRLNLSPKGDNYKMVRRYCKQFNLDTSHWTGQGWAKGRTYLKPTRLPLDEILVVNSSYVCNSTLRKRILREKVLEPFECSFCSISEWRNKPISLHLDHINGINNDHRIENLRWLCPNCDSQTPTYCGRNKGTYS